MFQGANFFLFKHLGFIQRFPKGRAAVLGKIALVSFPDVACWILGYAC